MSDAAWRPDPFHRHQYRWWDGEQWTDQVSDDGVQAVDAVGESDQSPPPPVAAQSTDMGRRFEQGHWDGEAPLLASKWQRLGANLLDALLSTITLFIGWVVWSLIIYGRGQTPAKQILDLRVLSVTDRRCVGWGRMALREWVAKGALPLTVLWVIFLVAEAPVAIAFVWILWFLWWLISVIMLMADGRNRAGWDRVVSTVVINDHNKAFDPRNSGTPSGQAASSGGQPRAW